MRARVRTYHAIPCLQAQSGTGAYKQLQDGPRLKSILKGAMEDTRQPNNLDELLNAANVRLKSLLGFEFLGELIVAGLELVVSFGLISDVGPQLNDLRRESQNLSIHRGPHRRQALDLSSQPLVQDADGLVLFLELVAGSTLNLCKNCGVQLEHI